MSYRIHNITKLAENPKMADNELMCECLSQHVAAHDLDVVPTWLSESPAPHTSQNAETLFIRSER